MDPFPAPPALEKINYNEIDLYSCTKCSSNIKIISIDEKNLEITFECLNKDKNNNHKIQTMPINEYIRDMVKNIYINDKCSICNKKQNSEKDLPIFKFCIKCQKIICNNCIEKHIKNNKTIEHNFINNNEKSIKCSQHSINNKNIEYCIDCKMHLCKECLKTRNHINHQKNPLDELQLLDENKLNHTKIIKLLTNEEKKLKEESKNKENELKKQLKESKKKIKDDYENKNKENIIKKENELKLNEDKLEKELEELKQKYLNDIQLTKNKFMEEKKHIIDNYKKMDEENEKLYKENLAKNKESFLKNKNYLDIRKLKDEIKGKRTLISINSILKKTQEKFEDNYYINENINKAIECFKNSENREIRNISIHNIEIQNKNSLINKKDKIIDDNNDNNNKNKIINNIDISDNIFLSKKIKNESDYFEENKNLKNINDKYDKRYKYENENYDNNSNNIIINSNINLSEEGEIQSEQEIFYKRTENKNLRPDKLNYNLSFNCYDIISDSYCPIIIDNSFAVFESKNNKQYLIYATKDKCIITYNLSYKGIERKIPSNHNEYITNLLYCFNYKMNKEIIMSVSYKDTNLKIWNFEDWQCLIDIKNIYSKGFLYAACFLNKQNYNYFITTNWVEDKFADSIKVYDYDKNIVKRINDSSYNSFMIKTLYFKEDVYIITSNDDNIKSYNYHKNILYRKYKDSNTFCKILSFLIFQSYKRTKVYASCHDKAIRIWDFNSSKLVYKINNNNNVLKGIRLAKEKNLLIGIDENIIQLISLYNGEIVKCLNKHKDKICSIKKKFLINYGSCIFSQGFDNHIILWNLKN